MIFTVVVLFLSVLCVTVIRDNQKLRSENSTIKRYIMRYDLLPERFEEFEKDLLI